MRTLHFQNLFVAFVQAVIGFEWIKAGWEKVTDPAYLSSMTGTLGAFAGKDPFGWYRSFLTGVGIPNAMTFGVLAEWGELLVGIALLATAALYLVRLPRPVMVTVRPTAFASLVVALFMSVNYWLAAGYLSVSTDGLNMLMALIELGLAISVGTTMAAAWDGRKKEPVKASDRRDQRAAA